MTVLALQPRAMDRGKRAWVTGVVPASDLDVRAMFGAVTPGVVLGCLTLVLRVMLPCVVLSHTHGKQ